MRKLDIYFNDKKAGVLTEQTPGRGYSFSYDDGYLRSDGYPISATLPKRSEPYRSDYLFPFFSNLLPEGANRKVICRALIGRERLVRDFVSHGRRRFHRCSRSEEA